MPEILKYRGVELQADPAIVVTAKAETHTTLAAIREQLLVYSRCLQVYFEPGDATRYVLVLSPITNFSGQRGLLVTRLSGGYPCGESHMLWDWNKWANAYECIQAGAKISGGNDWSAEVISWWLKNLCEVRDA